ncbi:CCA tRNA nucleotidyltransferase [Candidatus Woesearchaeota archaeon]|nr:CCA tRNA nucleotidyltransferase [Candidatus Woesearchaeota archaeon]
MEEKFRFLEQIRGEIRPDTSILKTVDLFIKKINWSIKKNKIDAVCVKGGSVAKGTFLKGDFDVDLFVKFDYKKYKNKNISDMLATILTNFSGLERVHGSRDYFQIKNSLNYEIVPVLDIKDPENALNVTDMSPLHVTWVKKNLIKGQDDEIRLTKLFCKAHNTYGAESYIKGFSGHVIDILVIYYGSFLELLRHAVKWKPKLIIDINKNYRNRTQLLFSINKSKTQGPLIVVDPIQPNRNAAAALSNEKFNAFIASAKDFLKQPDMHFFTKEKLSLTELQKMAAPNLLIVLEITPKKAKKDVTGSRLLKLWHYIEKLFMSNDFVLLNSGWEWNHKAVFWFILDKKPLPKFKEISGPPIEMKEHIKNFKEKYKNTYTRNSKIFAKVKRKYIKPYQIIQETIKKISHDFKEIKIIS